MVIGVIIEASPFHNGHQYFFNEIKKRYKDCTLVCVASSSFTMRGEISLINKFNKTSYLLQAGADIVFELPTGKTLHSGEFFAGNSIKLLNLVGVDKIICGATFKYDDLITLDKITSNANFQNELKKELDNHLSYKKAWTKALENLKIDQKYIELFNESNNSLAWEYYQTIKNNHYSIELEFINRLYNNTLPSGRMINQLVLEKQDINNANYLPFNEEIIDLKEAWNKLSELIKYNLIDRNNILVDKEGIDNYIRNNINYNLNNTDLITNLSNKKYSNSFIKRYLLKRLLHINQTNNEEITYIRLLGFKKEKESFINNLSKEVKKLIITRINDKIDDENIKNELLATSLYGLITNNNDLVKKEEKIIPIIIFK